MMKTEIAPALVPLTIEERSGVTLSDFVVSNGVPLPLGRVFHASELTVVSKSGSVVKAGFSPLQKWQDGSWRFVLVSFITDLAADEVKELDLRIGGFRPVENLLDIKEDENGYIIDTGKIIFEVSKRIFNVINRLWLKEDSHDVKHGTLVVDNHCTLVVDNHDKGVTAVVEGLNYTSSAGSIIDSSIERLDETHVVIRTEGRLGNGADEKLAYKVWIKAYAGSSEVDLQFNISKKEGDTWEDCLETAKISVDIPVTGENGLKYSFGGKNGRYEGVLRKTAYLYQKTSDEYEFSNDSIIDTVQCGKSDKSREIGWVDIKNGKSGMGAAYRWFWQNNPSALVVNGDGTLSIQVWAEMHQPYKFYTGVAKTTDIRLYFHSGDAPAEQVENRLKAFQLFTPAKCPASWYCQDTKAVDQRLMDMNKVNWPDSEHEMLKLYNKLFGEVYVRMLSDRDQTPYYAPGEDGYGFMNFGDGWEWGGEYVNPKHAGITWWSNNYYDHPYVFMLQFFRTGEVKYLDYALECEYHLMDIDTASYDPENLIPGEYKTCPSVAHIKHYMEPVKNERGEIIDYKFGSQGGHWHFQSVEGLFCAYYLTGCSQSVERGLESAEFAMQKHTMNLDSQTRTIGHTLDGLAAAYCHTWEQRYLDRMNWVWEQARELALKERYSTDVENPYRVEYKPFIYVRGNWPFQTGIVLGGAYKYRSWSPFVTGELGIDAISRNTMAYEIHGRKREDGFNGGWREEDARWNYASDIMTASASWLHPLFPEENFIDVMRKAAIHNLETKFADRCKTFSQSFKFQWLTQYELAREEIRNRLYVSFSAYPLTVGVGDIVTFNNQSVGGKEYTWSFGDGGKSDSADINVIHEYKKKGTYDIQLDVIDKNGKRDSFVIKNYITVK